MVAAALAALAGPKHHDALCLFGPWPQERVAAGGIHRQADVQPFSPNFSNVRDTWRRDA
jgi:hypothetical protein